MLSLKIFFQPVKNSGYFLCVQTSAPTLKQRRYVTSNQCVFGHNAPSATASISRISAHVRVSAATTLP